MPTVFRMSCICVSALLALCGAAAAAERFSYDIAFNDTILTADPTKLSLGDRFILNDKLLQDGAEAGSISGVCTITDVAGVAICNVSFVLPEGTLAGQFVNSPPPEKQVAILGGTGKYAGASGVADLIEHGDETGEVTFTLED